MPTPITFTLTDAGLNAALDADANGLTLSLTQIGIGSGQYAPLATRTALQTEIARYPLSGGDVEPNSKTLRFSAILESVTTQQAFEVGLFTSTGVLFAVASTTGTDPLILVTANIAFVGSFGMVLSEIPPGSVTVVTDPNAPLAATLLAQHVVAANPHPQYAMKAAFDSHVVQNGLEHGNILSLLNSLVSRFQAMLEFEYAIGCFYWTDRVGNPNTWLQPIIGYETFWRPIVGRSLMSVNPADPRISTAGIVYGAMTTVLDVSNLPPHDHADGEFNKLMRVNGSQTTDATDSTSGEPNLGSTGQLQSVGSSEPFSNVHPVYLSYCWQRYNPSEIRTITISEDVFDLVLLDLFVSRYGMPLAGERVKFIIEEGVLVTASSTTGYALSTGTWPVGSELTADVFGIVAGRGGNGATGSTPEFSATDGGACIFASHPLLVNNFNIVAGGGGGGGWEAPADNNNYKYGGGGGAPFGLGGSSTYDDYMGLSRAQDSQIGGRELGGLTAEYQLATDTWTYTSRVKGGNLGQSGVDGTPKDLPAGSWASFDGGLAGVAITGPVTVTGNPVLGR